MSLWFLICMNKTIRSELFVRNMILFHHYLFFVLLHLIQVSLWNGRYNRIVFHLHIHCSFEVFLTVTVLDMFLTTLFLCSYLWKKHDQIFSPFYLVWHFIIQFCCVVLLMYDHFWHLTHFKYTDQFVCIKKKSELAWKVQNVCHRYLLEDIAFQ